MSAANIARPPSHQSPNLFTSNNNEIRKIANRYVVVNTMVVVTTLCTTSDYALFKYFA